MESSDREAVEPEMMMSIILEQQEIIAQLVNHNRHLITLLAQYMGVEEEEKRLRGILKEEKE